MKKTITGFIAYRAPLWSGDDDYRFLSCELPESGYVTVMPHSFEVDIPDDFDPRPQMVKDLQDKKKKLMADFQARCTEIERKISELTALTCEAA